MVPSSTSADKELYNDSSALAFLLSKITYFGENFPIPDALAKGGLYNEMLSRCVKVRPSNISFSLYEFLILCPNLPFVFSSLLLTLIE